MKSIGILSSSNFEVYEKNKSGKLSLEDFLKQVRDISSKPDNETFIWLDLDYGYYDEPSYPELHIGVEE